MKVLEKDSKSAIDWFRMNMIVNPDEFQAMIMNRAKKENKYDLNANNSKINASCFNYYFILYIFIKAM